MTIILKQLFSFFQLLNSDTGTNQLAAGLALGIFLGFAPILSLQCLLILFVAFFFRVQLGAAMLSAFFFKFIAFLVDPASDLLGRWVLELPALRPAYLELYNMPFVPMTRFNNSIVMGSAIVSIILVVPAYFGFKKAILKYRSSFLAKYRNSKIWKIWSATTIYKWYQKYHALYG